MKITSPERRPILSVKIRSDVTVERLEDGRITLGKAGRKPVTVAGAAIIDSLAGGAMTEAMIREAAALSADPHTYDLVWAKLFAFGLLEMRCTVEGRPLFSLVPAPEWSEWQQPSPSLPCGLSSRAIIRREGQTFVLEMPLVRRRCLIHHDRCLAWLMDMSGEEGAPSQEEEARTIFRQALGLMGALEESEPPSGAWEFHDLLFFHYSSVGFHDYPLGVTLRLMDRIPPPPLLKPCAGEGLPLPEAEPGLMEKLHSPFSEVLALRRSGRIPGEAPISIGELGALLHTSACIEFIGDDPALPCPVSFRPSPSGGGLHSLEIYPLVYRCTGLSPGAYRYDPAGHRLEFIAADKSLLNSYLEENPHAQIENAGLPHVRLIVTSRILRDAWKYEKIAYRLVLQDLGCLYQTLSLTATALGLASCILGAVDARRLGHIMRLDPLVEPVVGEMTLSSR